METASLTPAPWLQPFAPWFERSDPRPSARLDLDLLNGLAEARGLRVESGARLRFVEAGEGAGQAYERVIAETGRVPTRAQGSGMLHDWFNALCWLRWPTIKARLNRLQAEALRERGEGDERGRLRDAVTLFDESGALFLTANASSVRQWQRFDWQGLFVDEREAFIRGTRVLIVGHALLEKLLSPYKGICAHGLALLPPSASCEECAYADLESLESLDALDRAVAALLEAPRLADKPFTPLPLLGVPGWWPANEDPAFYNDPRVFRHGRQRSERR